MFNPDIFDSLKNQEPVAIDLISKAARNNKFSHAYLLTGKNLETTNKFVDIFSRALDCQ